MMTLKKKSLLAVVAAATAFGMTAGGVFASAASDAPFNVVQDDHVVEGRIVAVNDEDHSFTVTTADDAEVMLFITERTTFTLDGNPATRDEALKAGASAKIHHRAFIASEVHVITE